MLPYKNKSALSITEMNGNTHTTINIPPRASVQWQKRNEEKNCSGADGSAKQNRLTFFLPTQVKANAYNNYYKMNVY
jgi:hypothetical protein